MIHVGEDSKTLTVKKHNKTTRRFLRQSVFVQGRILAAVFIWDGGQGALEEPSS